MVTHESVRPRQSRWQRFKFIVKVVEVRLRFVAVLVATALIIGYWDTLQNYWDRWTRSSASPAAAQSDSEYYCPMHPTVVRAGLEPNGEVPKCPICGMPLSLRKKGEVPELPPGVVARVQLTPERIALAGVRTEPIGYRRLDKELVTVGTVQYDETRLSRIVARVSGYLEVLHVSESFAEVEEGQPLAEVYSPELYSAARELVLAYRSAAASPELVRAGRERLRLFGVDPREIDQLLESGDPTHRLLIRSPQRGHVIHRNVVRGSRVEVGTTLFDVADLSTVWVEADVFERDLPFVRRDQEVEVRFEAFPTRVFKGRVSLVHPHLDPASRTNTVRLELPNPRHELRPGMFATVTLRTPIHQLEPFASLAADATAPPAHDGGPGPVFTCPEHPDVLMDRPGQCPRCRSELERRDVPADHALVWWCPMHPDVRASAPGAECEQCSGMRLVPRLVPRRAPGEVLVVPERAVIDTGASKVVYVEREPGTFEGVLVELGPRVGAHYPVVRGLQAGDRVAAEGAFLVDAETRLNPAAAATYMGASGGPSTARSSTTSTRTGAPSGSAPSPTAWDLPEEDRRRAEAQGTCPITGQPLGSMGTPYRIELEGRPVFLCCQGCEEEARADPQGTLRKLEPHDAPRDEPATRPAQAPTERWPELSPEDRRLAEAQGTCPITGEPLGSMGTPYRIVVAGRPVFLCCQGCEEEALADPEATLRKLGSVR